MTRHALFALFSGAVLVFLILLAPLRMALGWADADAAGLSAASVRGSLWSGELTGAAFRGLPLGEVEAGLDPLALLTGAARLKLQSAEGSAAPATGEGAVRLGDEVFDLVVEQGSVPSEYVARGLPLQGQLVLTGLSVRFEDGRCVRAAGRLALERLRLASGPDLPGLVLAGAPQCRDGALYVPLAGAGEGVQVEAELTVGGDGAWRLETQARGANPAFEAAAGLAGFARGLDGFTRTDQGRLAHAAG